MVQVDIMFVGWLSGSLAIMFIFPINSNQFQIDEIFGLTRPPGVNATTVPGITGTVIDLVHNFETIRYQDTIMGLVCIVVLLLMRVSQTFLKLK